MKKSIATFLILFIAIATSCQTKEPFSKFNLYFENIEKGIPAGWNKPESSDYVLALDSTNVKSGKYAASIEFKEGNADFMAWSYMIPGSYEGRKITLTGYIKTGNVLLTI